MTLFSTPSLYEPNPGGEFAERVWRAIPIFLLHQVIAVTCWLPPSLLLLLVLSQVDRSAADWIIPLLPGPWFWLATLYWIPVGLLYKFPWLRVGGGWTWVLPAALFGASYSRDTRLLGADAAREMFLGRGSADEGLHLLFITLPAAAAVIYSIGAATARFAFGRFYFSSKNPPAIMASTPEE